MGYSKSPVTLTRRQSHVARMFFGETVRWTAPFPEGADAPTWAYKVRECLHVARKHPARFSLARYADIYTVEIIDEKTVQASLPKSAQSAEVATNGDRQALHTPPPDVSFEAITFPDATDRFAIVQRLLSTPGSGPYHFPAASLSLEELRKLAAWADSREPRLMIVRLVAGITFVRFDPSIPESVRVMP